MIRAFLQRLTRQQEEDEGPKVGFGWDCVGFLDPKDDITPLEAANLSIFIASGLRGYCKPEKLLQFAKEKGIERHFSKTMYHSKEVDASPSPE